MKHILLVFPALFVITISARADVLTFSNGGEFDGDIASSTAVFTDFTITTLLLGGTATALNENSGTLGATGGSGSSASSRWDDGDVWIFEFDEQVTFDSIGFGVFTGASDGATLQSNSWIGASFTESESDLSFDSITGTFTFDGGANKVFNIASSVSGDSVLIDAEDNLVFTASDNFTITSLGFSSIVPEPNTYALLAGVSALGFVMLRRRSR